MELFNEGNYSEAISLFKEYAEDQLMLGCDYDYEITMNCITIEDRLSGELYSSIYHLNPRYVRHITKETHEDISFTEERDPDFK